MESINLKYFELCYDPLPFPVEIFDENGFVVYINSAFSKRWGYSLAELSGYSYVTDKELQKRDIVKKIGSVVQKKRKLYKYRTTSIQGYSVPIEQFHS